MDGQAHYLKLKNKAESIFQNNRQIFCPYFGTHIIFNSDGFHHLQFSNRRERTKDEQKLKFSLLPLALQIIKRSGTIQEYRTGIATIGKKGADGFSKTKNVEYWGLEAIIGENQIKVRTILRKIGDGKIIFWSVMPAIKLSSDKLEIAKRLAKNGIEDD